MNKKQWSPLSYGISGIFLGLLALILFTAGVTLFAPSMPSQSLQAINELGPTLSCVFPLALGIVGYLWGRNK
ncbi:MAG: hypothetical protein IPM53_25275 [Anaerolineaceae bacterium]|nr:hypothetical protein [Anaerolineaceae bacterium]